MGWLSLDCQVAGLQKFKFERREISNDAGVLIGSERPEAEIFRAPVSSAQVLRNDFWGTSLNPPEGSWAGCCRQSVSLSIVPAFQNVISLQLPVVLSLPSRHQETDALFIF